VLESDDADAAFPAHQHGVPREYRFVRQRGGEAAIEVDHHLGHAALGGRNPRAAGAGRSPIPRHGHYLVNYL
jgi:hypothetical protein